MTKYLWLAGGIAWLAGCGGSEDKLDGAPTDAAVDASVSVTFDAGFDAPFDAAPGCAEPAPDVICPEDCVTFDCDSACASEWCGTSCVECEQSEWVVVYIDCLSCNLPDAGPDASPA